MGTLDEPILEAGGESLTRSELTSELSRTKKSLTGLRELHGEWEFMPMIVDNSIDSHTALLAAAEMGVSVAVIDASVKTKLLIKILENFDSSVVILANPHMKDRDFPNQKEFVPLYRHSDPEPQDLSEPSFNGSVVVFSSGSTSDPKGVILPWRELINWTTIRHGGAKDSATGESRTLNISPISWVSGLMHVIAVLIGARLRTVNTKQFAPRELLAEIERFQPHLLTLTANLAHVLGNAAKEWKFAPIESIQQVMIGSGKVTWDTVNLFTRFIPETAIFTHNLSATEAFRMFHLSIPFGEMPESGQVPLGRPRIPENVRLEPAGDEDIFEVFAAGDIAVGYINKQKSLEVFSRDDSGKLWWKSGELVRIDRQTGEFYHSGRIDNIVKVNDHNVLLDDIESLLLRHPGIRIAAVVPVHINERIRIVAFVAWNDGSPPSERAIVEHLRDLLPKYSMPHHVINLSEFPLTRSGKTDRAALEELATSRFV